MAPTQVEDEAGQRETNQRGERERERERGGERERLIIDKK
jgi:hypothetical protein